jgi:hypothetical protein
MPVCKGCSASYDDQFGFCPHCGRAKPGPDMIIANVQASPPQFEEAVLKIPLVKKAELHEYPFEWRPNAIEKLLGDKGMNWTTICFYNLALHSIHPTKGRYVTYESALFRAWEASTSGSPYGDIKRLQFPIPVNNMLKTDRGRAYIVRLFEERKAVWEDLNTYLIQHGWQGLTDKAVQRKPPFAVEPDFSNWFGLNLTDLEYLASSHRLLDEIAQGYRYQRQIAQGG